MSPTVCPALTVTVCQASSSGIPAASSAGSAGSGGTSSESVVRVAGCRVALAPLGITPPTTIASTASISAANQ